MNLVRDFRRKFRRAAGTPECMKKEAEKHGCRKMYGIGHSRAIFAKPPQSGGYFPDTYDEAEAVFWYRKIREHGCQCLVDGRWEEEMVRKGLPQESEMSLSRLNAIPRFSMRDFQANTAATLC
jgi:hypothetical protein